MKRYSQGTHPYYAYRKRKKSLSLGVKKRKRVWLPILLFVLISITVLAGVLYARPLPTVSPQTHTISRPAGQRATINWPGSGSQTAFGTLEQGVIEASPNQKARPAASTIKLLTVLTVLDKKPLKLGETGPKIPITKKDVAIYDDYYRKNGSLAAIKAKTTLTQRQMLEGVLIPSANNYADSLAIWAFGSLEKYQIAGQVMAKKLDMKKTTVGTDASGFSPSSTSSAGDLVRLGIAAMQHPVVAEIVQMPEVNLPIAGVKRNTNWMLTQNNVVGIKTGNTDEVGGVFVFAAKQQVDGQTMTIVGAIQGQPTLYNAIVRSGEFIKQIAPQFQTVTMVKKGQIVATYTSPWRSKLVVVASRDIRLVQWPGETVKPTITLENINNLPASNTIVGQVAIGQQSAPIVTTGQFSSPSWQWRIFSNW